MALCEFGACLLFTDVRISPANPAITVVPIQQLTSSQAYSEFLCKRLADYIGTTHCLIVQWDGHVLDPEHWDPAFLSYDFIGASWPQFSDDHDVGNGGFSLRSKALLLACQSSCFETCHPEDVMIGRTFRPWLEAQGLRFAPRELADRFSAERAGNPLSTFGYHGVWHMPRVLGNDSFWEIYQSLDEFSTVRHDFMTMLKLVGKGRGGFFKALRLLFDRFGPAIKKGS